MSSFDFVCDMVESALYPMLPWLHIMGIAFLVTVAVGGVGALVFGYDYMQKKKDIEQQFKVDLEEAPYIAMLKSVLPFSYRFPQHPAKVMDHLYIGSEQDATNIKSLKELGITHIINCAGVYCCTGPSFYGSGIKYLQFEAEDDYEYDIMQHFPQAFSFIEDARKTHGKALIHCVMGINRSGALSVAYLMVNQNLGPISAAEQVRKVRTNLLSNDGFQRQLVTFARQKGLLHLDADKLNKTPTKSTDS